MKGNILVLTNSISGLYNFRKEVMAAIIDAGYQIFISEPDNNLKAGYFESIGCKIIKTKFNRRGINPFADIKLLLSYLQLIIQIRPVAVLTYTIKPNIYGGIVCRLTSSKQLANITGLGDAIENDGWLRKLSMFLYKFGISKAKRVFFQNQTNLDFFVNEGLEEYKTTLLPGSGVNLEFHKVQPYPENGIIKFLYITRLIKDKGVEEFFKMAEFIKKKFPETEFYILGNSDGLYQNRLNSLVKEGVVKYLGNVADIRPYLGKVHCTIMPSYHEGMSNVNLESAANGRPVITTNVSGCRETVDNGVTGLLVEAKNADDLINKVEEFINLSYDRKVAMGIAARRKMEYEFDRNIVIQAYLHELSNLSR